MIAELGILVAMPGLREIVFSPSFRFTNSCLWRGNDVVPLSGPSVGVLRELLEANNQLVTRHHFEKQVWREVEVGDDALTKCIIEIRQALGDTSRPYRYVKTEYGRGYRFIAPISDHVSPTSAESVTAVPHASTSSPPTLASYRNSPSALAKAREAASKAYDFGLPAKARNRQSIPAARSAAALHRYIVEGLADEQPVLFLIGRGGSGKTTVLGQLADLARTGKLEGVSPRIPIWLEHDEYEGDLEDSIAGVLRGHDVDIDRKGVETLLAEGRLLVFLDGLSDVRPDIGQALEKIGLIARRPRFRRSRFIIATRPLFDEIPSEIAVVELEPLAKEFAKGLVRRCVSDPEARRRVAEQLDAFSSDTIEPKLFSKTCEFGEQARSNSNEETFKTRSGFYRAHLASLLHVHVDSIKWSGWKLVLEHLAFVFLERNGGLGDLGLSQGDVIHILGSPREGGRSLVAELRECEVETVGTAGGLLRELVTANILEEVPSDGDGTIVKFRERTFEEYFAASYVVASLGRRVLPVLDAWESDAAVRGLEGILEFASEMVRGAALEVISNPRTFPESWRSQAGVLLLLASGAGLTSKHGFAHESVGRVYRCSLAVRGESPEKSLVPSAGVNVQCEAWRWGNARATRLRCG